MSKKSTFWDTIKKAGNWLVKHPDVVMETADTGFQMKQKWDAQKKDTNAGKKATVGQLEGSVEQLETKLQNELSKLRQEWNSDLSSVQTDLYAKLETLTGEVNRLDQAQKQAARELKQTKLITGIVFAVGFLVLAAVAIFL